MAINIDKNRNKQIENVYPLSPMQQGMLFHSVSAPESGVYVVQLHCVLHGALDTFAFEQAWKKVIERHQALRSAFVWENLAEPLQLVGRQVRLPWTNLDWRELSVDLQEKDIQQFLQEDRRNGFDLKKAPLMRFFVLQTADDTYHFIWSHHHMLLDGWSLPILLGELFTFYHGICAQKQVTLPHLRPYSDYVAWLKQQDATTAESFWREMLRGFSSPTLLPFEHGRSDKAINAADYHEETLYLSEETTAALQTFTRRHNLTLNTLVQAVWAFLLSYHSGEQDVLFGVTVSGRPTDITGIESMVGLFINTLPMRVHVQPEVSFLSWVQQLQVIGTEIRRYEYSSLMKIQAQSELPPGVALFENILVFENYPLDTVGQETESNLRASVVHAIEQPNYPLSLVVMPGQKLLLRMVYSLSHYEQHMILRLLEQFQELTKKILEDPEKRLGELSLLRAEERQQVLWDWNQTQTSYPREACVVDLFERQVADTPNAVAIVYGKEKVTYADLNCRANRLAHYLRGAGAGPETLVGLCLERSINQLVAILGIVKAEGAYLPLDPGYPEERLAMMLEDAAVNLIITEEAQRERMSAMSAHCIYLEQTVALLEDQSEENPQRRVYADNLLYVIYTSGSTGKPKGVCITQRAVVRLVCNTDYVQLKAEDRVVQAANIAFDASTFELWGTWLHGACIVMLMKDEILSLSRFAQVLHEQRVNTLFLTTALFNQMAREIPQVFTSLKHLLFGGEAVDVHRVHQVLQQGPPQRLLHVYGPTESTTFASWYLVKQVEAQRKTIPIGWPIANTQLYVLNALQQPVPVGATGELYVGGDGLARGYLNRPELTAEKFVPHPWGLEVGARLYRTGDVVKRQANGAIVFMGRVDHQVKIRGHRIELEEITKVLEQHPDVQEALVLVQEDEEKKQLIAYMIAKADVRSDELRRYLQKRLPDYMVPVYYVPLEAFPLTSNGKIDRRALPAPDNASLPREQKFVAAQTSLELQLAQIWTQVLKIEQIGIDDNFFLLGGDSILSIQISARAKQAGIALTPKLLFQHQSIAELITAMEQDGSLYTPVEQEEIVGAVPLTPIQHWFFEQNLSNPQHWNQVALLSVPAELKRETLESALHYLIKLHEALSLRFEQQEGQWSQIKRETLEAEILTHFDLSEHEDEQQNSEMERLATELQTSLDITHGPLIRAGLFELGARGRHLLLIIHHLVVDGVSWRILLEDLMQACEQLQQGQEVQLLGEGTGYRQWARKLSEYARSQRLKQELSYWLKQGEEASNVPLDWPQGENTEQVMQSVRGELSKEETRQLLRQVPAAYRTQINEVLVTALAQTLNAWMGVGHAVRIVLEGHGREDVVDGVDLSQTVGWFTALYPLRIDLGEVKTPGEALKVVKEQLRKVPNKGLGYGLLRYLAPEEDDRAALAQMSNSQISWNYLGQFDQLFDGEQAWKLANGPVGNTGDAKNVRPHILDVGASVIGEQLHISWQYSEQLHQRQTIERLSDLYLSTLRELIAHCLEPEAGGYTPVDFPLAHLDQTTLDKVIEQKRGIEDIYPLSPMQQGLLFLSLYETQANGYFEQMLWKIQGRINVQAFGLAWQCMVERHSILRTAFLWEHLPEPLQVVHENIQLGLKQYDWRSHTPDEQEQLLQNFLTNDRAENFQIHIPPLMRLTLCRLTDDQYQFIWSYHHLLLDGWSLPILLQELSSYYEAYIAEQAATLKTVRPYRDYIAWLQKQDEAEAELFWREVLRGLEAPTHLDVEQHTDKENEFTSEQECYKDQQWQLTHEETRTLELFVRQHKLTLNTFIQGTWALLLAAYSGQNDVIYGTTVSGRPAEIPGVETMVGLFINTLPVRVRVPADIAIVQWLEQLQQYLVELRRYESSSLVRIQGWSEFPKGTQLFESLLIFENYPVTASEQIQSDRISVLAVKTIDNTGYPLTATVLPGQELQILLTYDTRHFDHSFIEQMLQHWRQIIRSVLAQPEHCLAQISILDTSEQQRIFKEWNATQAAYPKQKTIITLFEEQVQRTPDASALIFVQQEMSYLELNRQANQLAHFLRSYGIQPETRVGLYLQRSFEMAVAILGILKAGGVYVPLDPHHPTDRLSYIIEDAQISVVLTQKELSGKLPAIEAKVISLEDEWEQITKESGANPAPLATPQNLVYAFYTSGSTGKPKGSLIEHQALVNYALSVAELFRLQTQDRVLQFAALGFDVTVEELFPTWIRGAAVILCKDIPTLSSDFLTMLEHERITLFEIPTAFWHQLVQDMTLTGKKWPASLRLIIIGGEKAALERLTEWKELSGPDLSLINIYGLTETTVTSCLYEVNTGSSDDQIRSELPIGRPIANTQLYVLNERLQPVPIGVSGELYIGGDGLARGYTNPVVTAERFIPDPLSGKPDTRLYKTGDRVRYRQDGNLEFIGRYDYQVKIRGYRIELGEIENVLSRHPLVKNAAVFVREDVPGNKLLVAYLIPWNSDQLLLPDDLRKFVLEHLPEYMVPSAFVMLDVLPLSTNGKLNRQALPVPARSDFSVVESYVAPRTSTEEILVYIWSQLLGSSQIGVYDNFFMLGGHSLLATQAISRIRETFHIELPLRKIFEMPTIADLAVQIEQSRLQEEQSPLLPVPRAGTLPLSFAQQRLWILHQLNAGPQQNIPLALRLVGTLDLAAFESSFTEIERRHEPLRTVFINLDGQPAQQIHPPQPFSLAYRDLSALSEEEREVQSRELAFEDAHQVFDLEHGPLMRATLLLMGKEEYVLLLTMHHIIFDGWSTGVLIHELVTLYTAFSTHRLSPLPELSIQYADFAVWQRQWLQGEILEDYLTYWKAQLASTLVPLELPTDRPRPLVQTFRGAHLPLVLSADLTQALKAVCREEKVTVFMLLLAAFATLLYRYSSQEDICIGSPIANRSRSELESLIGIFINTLVLRTDLSGNPTFKDLMKRVRETALAAYAHQDLPFEMLVEALQPERDLSRTPLFQVMFTLENTPTSDLVLPGLHITPVEISSETAKYDITLSMAETEGRLIGSVEYNTDIFTEATIWRMLSRFQRLLQDIAEHPEIRLSDLTFLTDQEYTELSHWNETTMLYDLTPCLHQLLEQQVEKTPQAIALVFEDEELSYAELNARANQLAHYLRRLGVGLEARIGICVERSFDMVIGLLAILKAGGTYIPFDPQYPPERLTFMLKDAQVALLLTTQDLLTSLPVEACHTLCLDTDWPLILQEPVQNPLSGVTPDNLAYIIYTSGSTGRPKGTMIPHRGICNRLLWMQKAYQLGEHDRVLQKTPFSFDVSVWEFFWPLLTGATLVIARPNGHQDSAYLVNVIQSRQITTIHFVPAMLQVFLEASDVEACQSLRRVFCSGEALSREVQDRFFSRLQSPLFNLYGPTEASVDVTYWNCENGNELLHTVPIGYPIDNIQIYLLDKAGHQVPVGVPGELHIAGIGLAHGYFNRPDLSAATFIPNPFSQEKGARIYKTGDLARYLPGGAIEYLGRLDYQMKVRGFRIEPGEIEYTLQQLPTLQDAVVLVRKLENSHDQQLVAYIVLVHDEGENAQQEHVTLEDIRKYLAQRLPAYMVPALFIPLDSLPLSPNGKVDRRSLLNMQSEARLESTIAYVAPRNELEEAIVNIWQALLQLPQVGIHDNFFALGGSSILALQAVARLLKQGIEVAPQQMFEHQTIAELVEALTVVDTMLATREPKDDTAAHALDTDKLAAIVDQPTSELPTLLEKDCIQPQNVFVTGATGFLGIYLLRELLSQTNATIYCLMRQHNEEEARKRIFEQIQWYFPDAEFTTETCSRVIPVLGDLGMPQCGIATEIYQMLVDSIDLIYHLGADVRQIGHYEHFIAVNVEGTREMLHLTQTGKLKVLHYVSTMSVAGIPTDPHKIVFSEQDLDIGQKFVNPYIESKFLAEKAVREAIAQGCLANVYRTPHIAADTQTGRFQRNIAENGVYRGLRANINMGVAAYMPEMLLDFVPVDFVARAIVRFSLLPGIVQGQTFHLQNPRPLSHYDLMRTLQAFGYPIALVEPMEYATRLLTLSDDERYLAELVNVIELVGKVEIQNEEAIPLRAENSLTRLWLKQVGLTCPTLTPYWLRLMIQHCIDVNYLDAPRYWNATMGTPPLF